MKSCLPLFLVLLLIGAPSWATSEGEQQATLKMLQEKFPNLEEQSERIVKRLGNKTLELESTVCLEADFETAVDILSNLKAYPSWILPGINKRAGGGEFYLLVMGMGLNAPEKIYIDFKFEFPL